MQKTTKIDGQETLQQLLREEFDFRKTRNPAYSMRAYARDLKLSAATLCQVLAGKDP